MAERNAIPATQEQVDFLKATITSIPDYPSKGILFRDITSLCENAKAFSLVIDLMAKAFADLKIDKVVSGEARGFVFGAPLAERLGAGFVMARKPNKLPRATIQEQYALEYGVNELQMHADSIKKGERVLCVDDLLATGGTMVAMIKLVQRLGGEVVQAAFVIDLVDLGGCDRITQFCGVNCSSLLDFPGH